MIKEDVYKRQLFARVWGADADVEEAILDNYIGFFRRRLAQILSLIHIFVCGQEWHGQHRQQSPDAPWHGCPHIEYQHSCLLYTSRCV